MSDSKLCYSRSPSAAEAHAQPASAGGAGVAAARSQDAIPPHSNTGGIASIEPYQKRQDVSADGAFVDWFSFTCKCSSFNEVSDDGIVIKLSNQLVQILGYGVTEKRQTGMNFYRHSYVLGNGWGFVCIGGQEDTVMVAINGHGCMAAKPGWEHRLYEFLPVLHRARITRSDLARDFFDGEYTPDQALQDYEVGAFSLGARMPEIEQRGNWIRPSGKGRTQNVGNRTSGKLARVYEKGLQLGRGISEMFPKWVRVELELHNQDREIPFDVLIRPGQYLAGAYPAFSFINDAQERIKTKKNTVKVVYDAAFNTIKHQFGLWLYVMWQMEESAEAILNRVVREGMPKRLNMACMDYNNALPPLENVFIDPDLAIELAFPGGVT